MSDSERESGSQGSRHGRVLRELTKRVGRGDTYVLLLVLLLLAYFLMSLLPATTWGRLLVEVVSGSTLVIALRTSHAKPGLQRVAVIAVAVGFVLTLLGSELTAVRGLVGLVLVALLVVTPLVILNRILRHPSVNIETIAGAVDVYIILGLIFAGFYRAVGDIAGSPFFVQVQHASPNQFMYFSFATLTTVGYGDLTPAMSFGRSVVVLEALTGQIFLVTLVARLVSLWPRRNREDQS